LVTKWTSNALSLTKPASVKGVLHLFFTLQESLFFFLHTPVRSRRESPVARAILGF
jgi:hypothetical protein